MTACRVCSRLDTGLGAQRMYLGRVVRGLHRAAGNLDERLAEVAALKANIAEMGRVLSDHQTRDCKADPS